MTRVELGRDPAEERRINLDTEGQALDAALDQVEQHANDEWLDFARHVVRQVAANNESFISDAIWEAGLGKPPEARVVGSVLRWARAEGLIEPTDQFQPSAQPGCHKAPRRVWRSLVYRESA